MCLGRIRVTVIRQRIGRLPLHVRLGIEGACLWQASYKDSHGPTLVTGPKLAFPSASISSCKRG
jgi:hypothetical protein